MFPCLVYCYRLAGTCGAGRNELPKYGAGWESGVIKEEDELPYNVIMRIG